MADRKQILIGKIVAPQGVRGEVRVQTYTANPSDLRDLPVHCQKFGDGAFHFVRAVPSSTVIIARLDGIENRNDAELLRGTDLFVYRDELPDAGDGQFYHADLIGMRVVRDDVEIGVVEDIQNYGGGDILELDNGDMVSLVGAQVDMATRTIFVRG